MDVLASSPDWLTGILYAVLGFAGWYAARLVSRIDWNSDKAHQTEKLVGIIESAVARIEQRGLATQGESSDTAKQMRGVEERLRRLEETDKKIVEAVERLTRLEEWRELAAPRLAEADKNTTMIAQLFEQNRTAFRLIDDLSAKVDGIAERVSQTPRAVVDALRPYMRSPA